MTSPPTVVVLITGLNFGGAEKQALILAAGMQERGWRVKVVSLLSPPESELRDFAHGLDVTGLGVPRRAKAVLVLPRLIRLLKQISPDVLVTLMFHANVIGKMAGTLAGVPVIVSSIRNEYFGGHTRELMERVTGVLARATVVNSVCVADALARRRVVHRDRLRVIPNAVFPTPRLDAEAISRIRESLDVRPRDFLWLAVGHLAEDGQKDYPTLFEAFDIVRKERPEARLRIAGDGPLRDVLDQLVSRRGLDQEVRLLGFRKDVPDLLSAANGLVMSSAWEGSPNAVLEAMASGTPVVATAVGGVPELIEPGVTGFLARSRDSASLADAMCRLMSLSLLDRKKMGETSRSVAEQRFGVASVCGQWNDLIAGFLRSAQGAPLGSPAADG